ncbi:MAG: hypothetical protein AABX28_02435 [Nanoarchaeota archaeon]
MKKILFFITLVFLVGFVSAINLNVEKLSSNEVIIKNVNQPAIFNISVKNLGTPDYFEFYNLLGFSMAPKGTVYFDSNEKNIQLMIYPRKDIDYNGFYTFKYFIRAGNGEEIAEDLIINVVELKNAFEIGSAKFNPESNSIDIYIHNKVNFNFDEINAKFSSAFFNFDENFPLKPYEKKEFNIQLNREDFSMLTAGFYTLNAKVNVGDENAEVEGGMQFEEKDLLTTTKKDYGLIIHTQIIEKKNDGNVVTDSETIVKKNIISRLFTTLSPEPDNVERDGWSVYYIWAKAINPGDTLEISVRTNWLLPLLIVFFIVTIVVLAKQYTTTSVVLRKKVSFVRATGGEFALKVSVLVHAKKYAERINVIDRLPPLVKIYERFGGEKPTRVNEKNKKIEWNFEKLEAGETRVLSYVIYSKVGVLGKFALPSATAIYEIDGEIREAESNRAFFISEQRKRDLEY